MDKVNELDEATLQRKRLMKEEYELKRDEIKINIEAAEKKADLKLSERAANLGIRQGHQEVESLERNIKVLDKQIREKKEVLPEEVAKQME